MWERCLGRFALRSHRQALRLWSVCVLQALTVRESGAACTQAVSALVLRLLYERGRIIVVGCRSSVPLFLSVFVLHSSCSARRRPHRPRRRQERPSIVRRWTMAWRLRKRKRGG